MERTWKQCPKQSVYAVRLYTKKIHATKITRSYGGGEGAAAPPPLLDPNYYYYYYYYYYYHYRHHLHCLSFLFNWSIFQITPGSG